MDITEQEFIRIFPTVSEEMRARLNDILSTKDPLVFTSKNAVSAISAGQIASGVEVRVYCLGGATKNEIKKYFPRIHIAGTAASASELTELISGDDSVKKVYFLCGDKRRDDLPEKLKSQDVDVEELIVYRTELTPHKMSERFDGIAFFSPSAVESFFALNKLEEDVLCFSVGRTTTEAIRKYTHNDVLTSDKASEQVIMGMILKSVFK